MADDTTNDTAPTPDDPTSGDGASLDSVQPKSRQELYKRIRETSRDELVLEEMKRFGFWDDSAMPSPPETLIKRRGELQRELNELLREKRLVEDRERLLKEQRQVRMKEAMERRKETHERRKAERAARAEAWAERQSKEVTYLGDGVSGGLNHTDPDTERLAENGLPVYRTALDLASAMGIELSELRFLTFARRVARVSHYRRFLMPKKRGGTRRISAPMPRLKRAQRWVLDHLLAAVPLHDAAHGFVPGRSIASNAAPHVGADVVVNMDLQNFFPTVTYRRVKGLWRALGYGEQVATVLALLCTEPDTDETRLDGQTYFVAKGERVLPQGAPTSPALTNVLCRRLDARMAGMADSLGLAYTRYADDLTFSGSGEAAQHVTKLLWRSVQIITDEGFTLHPDKLRVMRRGARQEVTGLVVNEKLSVDRRTMRRFRATLRQIELDGPKGKHWGDAPDVLAAVHGFASFVAMVDAERGAPLVARTHALLVKHRWAPDRSAQRPRYRRPINAATLDDLGAEESSMRSTEDTDRKKPWWKLW
ncbi:MAG: reverse transcriptase family protein [Bacteroidota bacterium]